MKDNLQKVAVYTHGCRLNQYESDGILGKFISSGRYRAAKWNDDPDIAIINTCTVTSDADSGNRNTIRKIIRKNPGAKIIVTGCHAETNPEDIQKLEGVDLVVDNSRKSSIFEIFENQFLQNENETDPSVSLYDLSDYENERFNYGVVLPHGHVRAYLKIQDGCNRKCSYCKIPSARGQGVSMPAGRLLEQFQDLRDRGIKEVVITGVNVGWYRHENIRFNRLIRLLLDSAGGMRIRLSSIEPGDVDRELAELTLHPNFCNYLHVPLQSGSREILRKMRRRYSPDTFRKRIDFVKALNPEIFLGTDVMVGFPGETEADFNDTLNLCEDIEFAKIHVFPFSLRENTEAEKFSQSVSSSEIKTRSRLMRDLSDSLWRKYADGFLKRTVEAVVEKEDAFGNALSDNYLSLIYDAEKFSDLKKGDVYKFKLISPVHQQKIFARPVL